MKTIAMIPARMGSQRLKKKNLREIDGISLISRAIRKCKKSGVFEEIWVNSEAIEFQDIADHEGVNFYLRPEALGDNQSTSEQYTSDFLKHVSCDYIFQVHSIAPLLTVDEVRGFVQYMVNSEYDALMSCTEILIECAMNGCPINFTFDEKTNSQELDPIQRICWSITGWKSEPFLSAFNSGNCATYSGKVGFYAVNSLAGHVIKTEEDLIIAQALMSIYPDKGVFF